MKKIKFKTRFVRPEWQKALANNLVSIWNFIWKIVFNPADINLFWSHTGKFIIAIYYTNRYFNDINSAIKNCKINANNLSLTLGQNCLCFRIVIIVKDKTENNFLICLPQECQVNQEGRGYWVFYYTSPQYFIIMFSYSLAY